MLRQSSRPRYVLMEPLEIRCNLTVIDPLAGLAEPVAQVPCDVVAIGELAPSQDSLESSINVSSHADLERIYPTD